MLNALALMETASFCGDVDFISSLFSGGAKDRVDSRFPATKQKNNP